MWRVGGSWGVTIVWEGTGVPDEKGRRPDDALAAVVTTGDKDLAALIVHLLNEQGSVYAPDSSA